MNDAQKMSYVHSEKGKVRPERKQSYISLGAPKPQSSKKRIGLEVVGFLFLGLWFLLSRLNDNLFMDHVCVCGVILCCLLMIRSAN